MLSSGLYATPTLALPKRRPSGALPESYSFAFREYLAGLCHICYNKEMETIRTKVYKTASDKEPFSEWLDDLDINTQAMVLERLNRVRGCNMGACRPYRDTPESTK